MVLGRSTMAERSRRVGQINAEPGNDPIPGLQHRRSQSRSIKDDELVFEEQRFGDDRPGAPRSTQANDRDNQVNKQGDYVAHYRLIVVIGSDMTRL